MQMFTIPEGTLAGFKSLTPNQAQAVSIDPSSAPHFKLPSDWSAVYPQLSFEMALNYLPNQFDRGYKTVQIVSLRNIKPITLLVHKDDRFTDGSLDSKTKADIVRVAYANAGYGSLDESMPLMDSLGELGKALCVLDAEDFELVIPHRLFSGEYFEAKVLFTFHQSDKIPGVVGSVEGFEHLTRWQLQDLRVLNDLLKTQLDSSECNELIKLINRVC